MVAAPPLLLASPALAARLGDALRELASSTANQRRFFASSRLYHHEEGGTPAVADKVQAGTADTAEGSAAGMGKANLGTIPQSATNNGLPLCAHVACPKNACVTDANRMIDAVHGASGRGDDPPANLSRGGDAVRVPGCPIEQARYTVLPSGRASDGGSGSESCLFHTRDVATAAAAAPAPSASTASALPRTNTPPPAAHAASPADDLAVAYVALLRMPGFLADPAVAEALARGLAALCALGSGGSRRREDGEEDFGATGAGRRECHRKQSAEAEGCDHGNGETRSGGKFNKRHCLDGNECNDESGSEHSREEGENGEGKGGEGRGAPTGDSDTSVDSAKRRHGRVAILRSHERSSGREASGHEDSGSSSDSDSRDGGSNSGVSECGGGGHTAGGSSVFATSTSDSSDNDGGDGGGGSRSVSSSGVAVGECLVRAGLLGPLRDLMEEARQCNMTAVLAQV